MESLPKSRRLYTEIEISSQLKGQPCQLWTEDSRVLGGPIPKSHYSSKDLDLFADLIVVCGDPQFLDDHRDVLLNPKVIIEVLSPSTEAFDRGEKFRRYRTYLTSLTDYVVVAQHRNTTMIMAESRCINGEGTLKHYLGLSVFRAGPCKD